MEAIPVHSNHPSGSVSDSDSFLPSVVFRAANHRDVEATCCPVTAAATVQPAWLLLCYSATLLAKEELALTTRHTVLVQR
jgi:hypothetical protein